MKEVINICGLTITETHKNILITNNTDHFGQLHDSYIEWWFNTFVEHCLL